MIIKFENVSCGYGNKVVVSNLNLQVKSGEATCILGPNGIGKTTIFKSLMCQLELLDGKILIDDTPVDKIEWRDRAKLLSYVPQAKNYSYQFTVEDIVLMGRAPYIQTFKTPSQEDRKIVDEVLEKLDIKKYSKRFYSELSGGEQQIILLARAMAQKAKFILLDEPASNLDYKNQKKLLDIISVLISEGYGVLMVSHNPEHAFKCCNKTLMIDKNKNYIYGATKEVVNSENLTNTYGVDLTVKIEGEGTNQLYCCFIN